jgi:hypothetical protein
MGCVYIDTCSTILPGELNTYNFKNLPVGSTIFFCIFQFFEEKKSSILRQIFKIVCIQLARQNRRARFNVNATHASPCQKKQFSKTLIANHSAASQLFGDRISAPGPRHAVASRKAKKRPPRAYTRCVFNRNTAGKFGCIYL